MKNYKEYTVTDLISDDSFVRWVQAPNDEDDRFWSNFAHENPAKLREIDEAIQFLKFFGDQRPPLRQAQVDKLHQKIIDRIEARESAPSLGRIAPRQSIKNRTYLAAAAVTIVLLALGSWHLLDRFTPLQSTQIVTSQKVQPNSALKEHVIPKGARSQVTLVDGTQVWINAGSRLQYQHDFLNGPTRDVYLQGEAFFDVTADKEHPFVVHVQGVEIEVLGTSFNVKGYEGDSKVETTLVHGEISIVGGPTKDNVTLAANQRAVFQKEKKNLLVENNVQTDTYTAWRQGVLVFDDQPLSEILPILERTFDVTIHTDDVPSLDCRFTAKISNTSLKDVLELFRTSDTIGYNIVDNDVFISGNFCED